MNNFFDQLPRLPHQVRGNSQRIAVETDWAFGCCQATLDEQQCSIPFKHTGLAHRFCVRQPHQGYCSMACFEKETK